MAKFYFFAIVLNYLTLMAIGLPYDSIAAKGFRLITSELDLLNVTTNNLAGDGQPFLPLVFHRDVDTQNYGSSIGKLVKAAYNGSLSNVPALLEYLSHVSLETRYHGLASLHQSMQANGHGNTNEMMTLLYFVKLAMAENSGNEVVTSRFENLKAKFPSTWQTLIFSDRVLIRNHYYNEYMYVSSKLVSSHRIVLTWRPGGSVSQSPFRLVILNENGRLFYTIRNDFYERNAPMCQSSSYFNSERRKIVTCPNEGSRNDFKWVIEPVGSNNYFTIKNYDGTFLYSPNDKNLYDRERRYVFTWKGPQGDLNNNPKKYWHIENGL